MRESQTKKVPYTLILGDNEKNANTITVRLHGTNENINGLLREFYPKKFDFSTITQNELDIIVTVIK